DVLGNYSENTTENSGSFRAEVAAPGFINFYLENTELSRNLEEVLNASEKVGRTGKMSGKKVILEFTDPNPFKEFHIGHVYTNTIGEALSRLYEAVGATVHRADYFGDVGMHVAKALFGLQKMFEEDGTNMDTLSQKPLNDRIAYFGQAYAKGSSIYEEDTQAQEEMKALNKLVYLAAQKMWQEEKGITPQVDYRQGAEIDEEKLTSVYNLYRRGREWSLEYFDSIYKRLGMKFAGYYPESIAGEKGFALVREHISDGVFVEDNGAVIFPGKDHNLHNRVFINSLGLPTYEAKELGLAVWKNEEFPYDFSIIITGNEINEYFKVLMKALSLIKPDLAAKSKHIGHGMVKLASGKKMSSRTGQIIAGEDVLDEAKNLAKQKIAEAKLQKDTVEGEDEDNIAEKVGVGAIKYSFLKSSIGNDIPFSFEESVSFDGNAGPYVQYTYTRTQSVLGKAEGHPGEATTSIGSYKEDSIASSNNNWNSLQNDISYQPQKEETEILRKLYHFSEIVEEAALTFSPNSLTEYLFELSQMFNNFYQKYRILNAPKEEEKRFRLGLTQTVGIVIREGLYLLGIESPEKM
ncbi:MAG TPA: arginine--tRNA ligase, partial [Patescibacteria group bacterium]